MTALTESNQVVELVGLFVIPEEGAQWDHVMDVQTGIYSPQPAIAAGMVVALPGLSRLSLPVSAVINSPDRCPTSPERMLIGMRIDVPGPTYPAAKLRGLRPLAGHQKWQSALQTE